ncbi:ABC transporter substrate-binding protein [Nonomuraea sp. NPDC046802]|uniref:ABC transporter substrate-binding protein n=1 Tax=Nonomuraea sp. NPDC046802 TaxID=3154919 RepID=UPI00340B8E6C
MHVLRRRGTRGSGVAVMLAASLGLTACGGGTAQDRGATPVLGGTLRFAVHAEPSNLDPHASPSDVTGLLTRPVLDSLVAMDGAGRIRPWLAESWKVSADHRTYTFTLRDGVRFSDGTPFDAAAVKANLDHVVDPRTKSALAAGLIPSYRETEVVDARTARVELSRPHSPLLSALSTPYLGMQSPAALKKGPEFLARQIVGSGPFVMESFVPRQGAVYHRNPNYAWPPQGAAHTGAARLERLQIRTIPEDSVRVGALTSGQVDAIGGVPPVNVEQLRAGSGLKVDSRQAPGGTYNYYPNTASGPFTDVRVRQAFGSGIDFATIVEKLYFGVYEPSSSPVAPGTAGYAPDIGDLRRYDPQAAAALLDQAGWTGRDPQGYRTKDGRRLTIRWMFVKSIAREQRDVLAEQVQAAARKLGFEVRFLDVTLSTYAGVAARGDYDLADFSWQRVDADALRDLFHSANVPAADGAGSNAARYSDPQVDAWLDRTLRTEDPAERAELYADVQRKVIQDAAVFPVYSPAYVLAVGERARDIGWEQQAYPSFYGAWVRER